MAVVNGHCDICGEICRTKKISPIYAVARDIYNRQKAEKNNSDYFVCEDCSSNINEWQNIENVRGDVKKRMHLRPGSPCTRCGGGVHVTYGKIIGWHIYFECPFCRYKERRYDMETLQK